MTDRRTTDIVLITSYPGNAEKARLPLIAERVCATWACSRSRCACATTSGAATAALRSSTGRSKSKPADGDSRRSSCRWRVTNRLSASIKACRRRATSERVAAAALPRRPEDETSCAGNEPRASRAMRESMMERIEILLYEPLQLQMRIVCSNFRPCTLDSQPSERALCQCNDVG